MRQLLRTGISPGRLWGPAGVERAADPRGAGREGGSTTEGDDLTAITAAALLGVLLVVLLFAGVLAGIVTWLWW
jgi:hypothetical protein